MALPDFLIIGSPKCGTTSLHYYLDDHPEIFMPKQKELHYFTAEKLLSLNNGSGDKSVNQFHVKDFEKYQKHFSKSTSQSRILGEVSPSYINYPEIIPTIKKKLGTNIKIVIILRDPIERAFSNYLHLVREKREELSFYDALNTEEQRKEKGYSDFWYYKWNSLYACKVKKYFKAFDQVYVMTNEDLQNQTLKSIQNLYQFLGVESRYEPKNLLKKYNPGGLYDDNILTQLIFRQSKLRNFIKQNIPITAGMKNIKQKLLKTYEKPKPKIDLKAENLLIEYFKNDIKQLKNEVDLDFQYWNVKY